ncbi:MAG: FAD-binding protein [Thermoanaerobacteraceae bacterium]|nr:FAD-binding protein [Thermoanaerobacteraceae bacterium]
MAVLKKRYDAVIVGAGGAGVSTAINLAKEGVEVAVIAKHPAGYGDTRIADGIMVSPGVLPGDSREKFLEDILAAGEGLNDRELVNRFVDYAFRVTAEVERIGHLFRRDERGAFSEEVVSQSGGHQVARSLSSPPANALLLAWALRSSLVRENIDCFEDTLVFRIFSGDGAVHGAAAVSLATGDIYVFESPVVVLATGGGGWLYYPNTDCTREETGDGYALGLLAGAEAIDMEQVQFIPFALAAPASYRGIMVGEPSVAGDRGVLLDRHGKVILDRINRKTRTEVTRAMGEAMLAGRAGEDGSFWLDLTANKQTGEGRKLWLKLRQRGRLAPLKRAYGEAAYNWEKPFPVIPSAHYFMGGLRVDHNCETRVSGLYAVGQVQGGLHGGGRLGSLSLAELFTGGKIAAEHILQTKIGRKVTGNDLNIPVEIESLFGADGKYSPAQLTAELQSVMNESAGILRSEEGLARGLARLQELKECSQDLAIPHHRQFNLALQEALELPLMLLTAEAVLQSALARKESRGAHLRRDYPEQSSGARHVVTRLEESVIKCTWEGVN